ncbi:eukaryotic translation initiation factor 3 subunit A-like protein [Corchorus olitorius]|uniref:Eukaryotic translation initiation factor 3 subunit A-like protein n=1 Tax=Corchorus olitorius TaxID=93759 RepID=A0A1R3GPF0_9ROSI|nr:eukaryotic translation initiation factor 3 subunit A-like protein [Corchorus olitorius]
MSKYDERVRNFMDSFSEYRNVQHGEEKKLRDAVVRLLIISILIVQYCSSLAESLCARNIVTVTIGALLVLGFIWVAVDFANLIRSVSATLEKYQPKLRTLLSNIDDLEKDLEKDTESGSGRTSFAGNMLTGLKGSVKCSRFFDRGYGVAYGLFLVSITAAMVMLGIVIIHNIRANCPCAPRQSMEKGFESHSLRSHLTIPSESLNEARAVRYPPANDVLLEFRNIVDKDRMRLLARKSIIGKREEEQDRELSEMELEAESKKQMFQKKTEEAEKKGLAALFQQLRPERIQKEMEEQELEEAWILLQQNEKHLKRWINKLLSDGEKLMKQTLIENLMIKQLKESQEPEKRLQKVAKTMDHLERDKREEAAPLIENAFQQRLVEEKVLHEHDQQLEVELSRQRHEGNLRDKNWLSRMSEIKERVRSWRQARFDR